MKGINWSGAFVRRRWCKLSLLALTSRWSSCSLMNTFHGKRPPIYHLVGKTENFRQFQKASEGVFRGRRYNGTLSKKIPRIKLWLTNWAPVLWRNVSFRVRSSSILKFSIKNMGGSRESFPRKFHMSKWKLHLTCIRQNDKSHYVSRYKRIFKNCDVARFQFKDTFTVYETEQIGWRLWNVQKWKRKRAVWEFLVKHENFNDFPSPLTNRLEKR